MVTGRMGFVHVPEKLLALRYHKESTIICPSTDDNYHEETIVSLRDLFTTIVRPIGNGGMILADKLSMVDLTHCGLTELPKGFETLNLTHLCLSHNELKNVPRCLYNGLKDILTLDLSFNFIKYFDLVPECINSVKVMKLNNNKFGNIPKWFLNFKCINLEEFDYSSNKSVHCDYPKNSYSLNLIKLRKLNLINCCLIDGDYNFLRCFKLLQYLDISNKYNKSINRFHDIDGLFIKLKWKQLKVLKLINLSIPIFPEGIAWLESLVELYMADNSMSWLPHDIAYMVNLEIIDISNNYVVSIPEAICNLERLRVLKAPHNSIEVVPDLSMLSHLTCIDLYNNLLQEAIYNTDLVRYIDLERNYVDTQNLGEDYLEKKQLYRLDNHIRIDGPKLQIVHTCTDSSTSSDSEEEIKYMVDIDDEDRVHSHPTYEEQNWDSPSIPRQRHSDVDSVDDEWQGEDAQIPKRTVMDKVKVYIADEDWMFTDVD